MNFIGNSKIVSLLHKSLEKDKVNHAYIFSGPEHLGKFLLASMFAESLVLNSKLNENDISEKNEAKFDMIIIEPEIVTKNGISKQRDISIESIREAQKTLSLFPYHRRRKVMIINDAHRLNVSSQNALLKTLEEPNDTSMIVLVTHEMGKILPTIRSRCALLNFGLVTDDEKNAPIGRPGLAKIYATNPEELDIDKEGMELARNIFSMSINDRLKKAEVMSKDVVKTLKVLNAWIWFLRRDNFDVQMIDRKAVYAVMEKIEKSVATLKSTNASARLILEALLLEI
jgi:DNA polymerase III gamma/tau subunit